MLSPNGPFPTDSFLRFIFLAKAAVIKTKSATTVFSFFFFFSFVSPHSFFFSFLFSFASVILELVEPKKPVFWRLFTEMTGNSIG